MNNHDYENFKKNGRVIGGSAITAICFTITFLAIMITAMLVDTMVWR